MNFADKIKQRLEDLQKVADEFIVDTPISDARFAICVQCPELFVPTKTCKQCGCFMNAKTKLVNASCPLGKW